MFTTPQTADEILKEMWEYQSLDLGRHYLTDDAWDANLDASVVVKHGDGAWRLYVDGAAYGEPFPDRISACQSGHELIATEVDVQARAMARHDVPADLWEAGVVATQFRHRQNRDLTMYHSTGRWFVILGQCPFGQYSSAREASIALLKAPPIDPASIRLLETIYGRSAGYVCHLQDMETLAEVERQGFVSITETEGKSPSPVALLTEKGRAAVNADPRGLALTLRDIILANAQDDVQRSEWNRYFSVGSYEGNGRNLQEALAAGLELHMDVVESEPNELCIKANGTFRNGQSARDMTIMLLCPHWTDQDMVESATALINTILNRHDALVTEAQRLEDKMAA